MNTPFDKYLSFQNRLEKVYRHLGKAARRQGITCYRVYDHDLPEFPFIIEVFEEALYVSEYKRRHLFSGEEHRQWLEECCKRMCLVLGVDREKIFLKTRQRKESRDGQYQKLAEVKNEFIVTENNLKFLVNLTDYLDTGLFLDHRTTRQMVREESAGKRVLNLFCYTGSFSVYALAGGALEVQSVDLSKTYLSWTERNVHQNFPDGAPHITTHADVLNFLQHVEPSRYDLIVMDPPTFSNSKRMTYILDIQRDHPALINHCLRALSAHGVLYFSTNYTRFQLAANELNSQLVKDITKQTTPFDFAGKLKRQCFRITK